MRWGLHRHLLAIVREDHRCRDVLMTAPGVGAVVAITFKSGIDDPGRFPKSRAAGAHFGLTPKKYQSDQTDVTGGINRAGDAMVRAALYEAAHVVLSRSTRFCPLKRRAMDIAKRRGPRARQGAVGAQAGLHTAPHVGVVASFAQLFL